MRESIAAGTFAELKREFLAEYSPANGTVREEQRARWMAARGRK
jgi:hypothetical protein